MNWSIMCSFLVKFTLLFMLYFREYWDLVLIKVYTWRVHPVHVLYMMHNWQQIRLWLGLILPKDHFLYQRPLVVVRCEAQAVRLLMKPLDFILMPLLECPILISLSWQLLNKICSIVRNLKTQLKGQLNAGWIIPVFSGPTNQSVE